MIRDLEKPGSAVAEAFADLSSRLLNQASFLIAGREHRLAEIEVYYYHEKRHPDPFTHRRPLQREWGRWYFHRTGESYRGGSFKGLDLTLGDGRATVGILIRSVVTPSGDIISGPSRTVDYLLATTGARSVRELDARIAGRTAWDAASPLLLQQLDTPRSDPVLVTARVGLSLKRHRGSAEAGRFVMKPYRYLTEPRRITKGRPQTVLALHQIGNDPSNIRSVTGVPGPTIHRYIRNYQRGLRIDSLEPYFGVDLTPESLCRLLGSWTSIYRRPGRAVPTRG